MGCGVWGVGFYRFSGGQLPRVCWKSFSWGQGVGCGVWGVGFYRFWGSQLPNFQGKSTWIFPPIPATAGTFWGKKSLKVLSNKVFRFIQQTLPNFQGKSTSIFPLITPMPGTFWLTKSLKVLPNKVFRFIQQTLSRDWKFSPIVPGTIALMRWAWN